MQLGHYRTRFTACGVFHIDYSCLSKVSEFSHRIYALWVREMFWSYVHFQIASLAILIIFFVKLAQGGISEEYTEID